MRRANFRPIQKLFSKKTKPWRFFKAIEKNFFEKNKKDEVLTANLTGK